MLKDCSLKAEKFHLKIIRPVTILCFYLEKSYSHPPEIADSANIVGYHTPPTKHIFSPRSRDATEQTKHNRTLSLGIYCSILIDLIEKSVLIRKVTIECNAKLFWDCIHVFSIDVDVYCPFNTK